VPSQTLSIDDFVDLCEQLPIIDGHRKGVFTHTAYSQAFFRERIASWEC